MEKDTLYKNWNMVINTKKKEVKYKLDCGREYGLIRTVKSTVKVAMTGLIKQVLLFLQKNKVFRALDPAPNCEVKQS